MKWFDEHARVLPWRSEPTPYRVWISEIMLQQTQVATVLPYFDRFLKTFPDVASLAGADEQLLMKHWEGLGYYRRARSMHAAAAKIVADHDGKFPESFDDVLALPGIGRYTAGAILSISRDQRLPILEGNTVRVFSRWIALRSPVNETASTKVLWEVAEAMLPAKSSKVPPGHFNQAAMELGALVCTPKSPSCDTCPVRTCCRAHALGLETTIPGKVNSVKYESRSEFAFVIADENRKRHQDSAPRYLVRPLPAGGRWAGLWDFPRTTEMSFASVEAAANDLAVPLGGVIRPTEKLTTIKHAVTKYRISLDVHTAVWADGKTSPPKPWRYVTTDEMDELPMSVTGRKIAKLLK
ncbi:A/G-specific adenine glycosylase [Rubripirellula tenax]|uniref:Adenine DNA glycosylase n=1 Tax=Rubripirellula tenax TaxID=2528015 RepID=A0A5C6FJL9_9BACT|nr:A/G-specific adenine glycosylase [Rubripirellula tenax]TWU60297.1 A/G-specific adenine glycosylase [Rubripirellula tenax]